MIDEVVADTIRNGTRRRVMIGLGVAVGVGAFVGMIVLLVRIMGPSGDDSAACPASLLNLQHRFNALSDSEQSLARRVHVLIDPASNSDSEILRISNLLVPHLLKDTARPLLVSLYVHRGDDTFEQSTCLNGVDGLYAVAGPREHEDVGPRNLVRLQDGVRLEISRVLARTHIHPTGGPAPFFAWPPHVEGVEQEIILLSDMLANDRSCLDGTVVEVDESGLIYADNDLADAVVDRCASMGTLPTRGSWTLVGAGEGERAAGLREYARRVAESLCTRVGEACSSE